MKIKKKWKKYVHQIALACLLICCVVQWIPDLVYADSSDLPSYDSEDFDGLLLSFESVKTDFTDGNGEHVNCEISASGSKKVYLIKYQDSYALVSREPFSCTKHYTLDDGTTYSNSKDTSSIAKCDHYQFYTCPVSIPGDELDCVYYRLPDWETLKKMKDSNPSKYDSIPFHFYGGLMYDIQCMKMYSVEGKRAPGSVNNPIEDDEEIGTPIITKRRYTTVYHDTDMGNASDGKEDIDDSQFIFDWSNKTSTGFNLKKNKYHMTRIQIKVQSKCVVYSGFSHKTVKKRFDNYGEMSSEIKSALVDDTPYSIEYGTVKSMLPKTFSEKHNPLYVGRNFTFYFRVMCNESASGTGKWHCGAWRAVGLNASTTQDQTDESSNGHIDSDGNYTKDPDDGHNNSDSDSSTVDDKEDAKDQFKDDQKNGVTNGKNDSSGFEWSDLKKLVNECKEVPALIKSVFSFLPDWVLVFVAVGFGIWIFVLIKRAIV